MKGNWWLLAVAFCALSALVAVCMGAQLYRWEAIVWLLVAASNSIVGYGYSRWLASAREDREARLWRGFGSSTTAGNGP